MSSRVPEYRPAPGENLDSIRVNAFPLRFPDNVPSVTVVFEQWRDGAGNPYQVALDDLERLAG